MGVDTKIVHQRARQRINDEYQMSISDDGLKSPGISERYTIIYKEEYDKELKQQTPEAPPPSPKPAITTCNYNPQPTPNRPNPNIKCNFGSAKVEKSERKHVLTIDKNTSTAENILEIVAGYSSNVQDVTITVNGLEGPCVEAHKNKVMALVNPKPISKSDTVLKFKAASLKYTPFKDSLWPTGAPVNTYNIPISTCNLQRSVVVKVFPDIEYDFSVKYNSKPQKTLNGFFDSRLNKEEIDKTNWSFEGSITQDKEKKSFEVIKEFQNLEKALTVYETICDTITVFLEPVKSAVEIEINPLCINFSLNGKWKEIEDSPKCGYECTMELGLIPIAGITFKINLVGVAIKSLPGVGLFLYEIIEKIEKSQLGSLRLDFYIGGDLNIKISGSKTIGQSGIEGTANGWGNIIVGLKGKLEVNSKKYTGESCGLEGGGSTGGEAKVGIGAKSSTNDKSKIDIYYNFNGFIVSYAFYLKANAWGYSVEKKQEKEVEVFKKRDEQLITTIDLKNK